MQTLICFQVMILHYELCYHEPIMIYKHQRIAHDNIVSGKCSEQVHVRLQIPLTPRTHEANESYIMFCHKIFVLHTDPLQSTPEITDLLNKVAARGNEKCNILGLQLQLSFAELKSIHEEHASQSLLCRNVSTVEEQR